VHVAVDQPRDDAPPSDVVLLHRHPNRRHFPSYPEDALSADEQMHPPARLRIVQLGIEEKGEGHPKSWRRNHAGTA
jgi:hypothetical protein